MVSGLAGLILALKPDLKPDEVAGIIKSTATNVDGVSDNYRFAGLGGTGRINAKKALEITRDCFTCTTVENLPLWDYNESGTKFYYLPNGNVGCTAVITNYTTPVWENATVEANRSITLKAPLTISAGSTFIARIGSPCKDVYYTSNNARIAANETPPEYYTDYLMSGSVQIPEEKPRYDDKFLVAEHTPNPVTQRMTITFSLPSDGVVRLKITDVSGRVLDMPLDALLEGGTHEYHYDASKLSNGLYIYTIESPDGVVTNKFVVTK
jgi:hypothetical protein